MTSNQPTQSDDSNSADAQSVCGVPPENQTELFPVVGIGASAGGLEAFTQLLSHLPIDTGMAFVLVQHLAPTQKSLLSEILARTTQMPICEGQEGMAVEPNHVYVIPPNTTMTIVQGRLCLKPRDKTRKISKSVDTFFDSLAQERGNKAIGVVLSGGNDDGALGIEAIKAAGGITFAQTENSSQISSMPNTAIATGQVDFILSPAAIAVELGKMSRYSYVTNSAQIMPSTEHSTDKDVLLAIFHLLYSAFGVDFTNYKYTTIKRRLFRRMALYRLEKLDDYVQYLQKSPAEVQALYQEILIHVTSFFRDAEAFEILKREVFPVFLHHCTSKSPIRIWVAGCSTGEEAYSITICLLEFLAHQPYQPSIQIFATDVSELAIAKARTGIYLPSQIVDVSPERLQGFFVQINEGYQIKKTVREHCIFAQQNLISDPPFSRMDLIICRNVLIYFGASLQKKVLSMFHYGLKPTGFLMLGPSETVGDLLNLFHVLEQKHKLYAKQPTFLSVPLDWGSTNHSPEATPSTLTTNELLLNDGSLSQAADQIVLSHYAPAGVVVNAQLNIVQFRGQTGAYLAPLPGQASLNLFNMVKAELSLELRTAIHQAKEEGKAVKKEDILLFDGEHCRMVQLDVFPLKPSATSDDYFLILFQDRTVATPVTPYPEPAQKGKPKSEEQAEIRRLEQQLETTKVYLQRIIEEQQSTNEDLRAANEEVLSSNEELQSTNEELQTAKEEIQATNEELSTINDELYRRNTETIQVSNDFQNLLASIHIPILMLAEDLRIRRFTPTAAPLFNLIPTDIGRPFSDIKHNLSIADLEPQILEVINTLIIKSQEVQDQDGHWYDLRIRPYRTIDNRIDGAVLVLVEIDFLKRSAEELRAAQNYAEAIIQTVSESFLVLNENFQVIMANQPFYDTFQVLTSETEQRQIFALGNGQWDIPQLRLLLNELLLHNTQVENFQVEHEFENIGQKIMLLNVRKLHQTNGNQLILLAIQDKS